MEWLSKKEHFLEGDLSNFQFDPNNPERPFMVQTARVHIDEEDKPKFYPKKITSEGDYNTWINESRSLTDTGRPTILLAMHKRVPTERASCVPYAKETLAHASKALFQHRSLSSIMPRVSHAVLNRRQVTWEGQQSFGPSTVYNCRSDVVCPEQNDILMSVTTFPDIPITFGVMYGCTDVIMEDAAQYLKSFKRAALHPLMLPMMFVEIERKRLIGALRTEMSRLSQRILEMELRLSPTQPKSPAETRDTDSKTGSIDVKTDDTANKSDAADDNETMLQKDCKAANLWFKVSELKNGVQSLMAILESMATHCLEFRPETEADAGHRRDYTKNTEKFQARVGEMMIELGSQVQKCDGVLGGMQLATQMEWNYHSRRDAKANIIIAYASKRDSSQMRYISFLGMVFLPGTFLATLFSMTFFNWIPDESPQVISPWIGLYCGSAAMLTLLTYLRWRKYIADQDKIAVNEVRRALMSDTDSFDSFP